MIAAITVAVVLVATRERWLPRKDAPAPVATRPAAPEAVVAEHRQREPDWLAKLTEIRRIHDSLGEA